jgi:broad specificity phosphatase PhoE
VLAGLHLVRHGEVHNPDHLVYADLPGFYLSNTGRSQAAATAARLGDLGADLVVSSPLDRAVQTASPISKILGVPLSRDDRLTEWLLARRWAGVAWEQIPVLFPGELEAYLAHPHDLPFSPESIADVAARVVDLVAELGTRHPGATAVLVSHQDPLQAARLSLTARPPADLAVDRPGHGSVISLAPGTPWTESASWSPPVAGARPFPPST